MVFGERVLCGQNMPEEMYRINTENNIILVLCAIMAK